MGESDFVTQIVGVLVMLVSVQGCIQAVKGYQQAREVKIRRDAEDIVHHELYRSIIRPVFRKALNNFVDRYRNRMANVGTEIGDSVNNPSAEVMQLYAELYRDMCLGPQCFENIIEGGVKALRVRNGWLSHKDATLAIRQAYFATRIHQASFRVLKQVSNMIACGYTIPHFDDGVFEDETCPLNSPSSV